MSLIDWANLANTVQSFAVALAIVVGGGWALYQYVALKSVAKARAELEMARQNLRKRGVLNITLEHKVHPSEHDGQKCVLITSVLKNAGNRTEMLDLKHHPVSVRSVCSDGPRVIEGPDEEFASYSPNELEVMGISPGEEIRDSFVVFVPGPGLYAVKYSVPALFTTLNEMVDDLAVPSAVPTVSETLVWTAETLIYVE